MREIVLRQVQCLYQCMNSKPILDCVKIKGKAVPVCAIRVYGVEV